MPRISFWNTKMLAEQHGYRLRAGKGGSYCLETQSARYTKSTLVEILSVLRHLVAERSGA